MQNAAPSFASAWRKAEWFLRKNSYVAIVNCARNCCGMSYAHPLVVVTAPVIYSLIFPLLLLDLFVTVYQAICFPAYGIAKVRRGDYFAFDRYHLEYLNALEKLNCGYCSYANGLIAYVREIAGRTEKYWCPIKHARRMIGAHPHYARFLDYGDATAFREPLK